MSKRRRKSAVQAPTKLRGKGPAKLPDGVSPNLARILRPQAAYRWLLPQLAAITPQYIEMTLRGALMGSHVQAWELFDLMEDTWPRLVKNANQLKNEVVTELKSWNARPFQEEDEPTTESAKAKARLANRAIFDQRPEAAADENGFSGMVYDIMDAWLKGVAVLEVDWELRKAGSLGQIIAPRATFWVHPVCYTWSLEGRLGLRTELANAVVSKGSYNTGSPYPTGSIWQSTAFQPRPDDVLEFPRDKFIVAIQKAKSGSALGGARLRSLAWWWCAANFSADWLLNLAQLWQIPFRWASYDPSAPQATIDAICSMLENMGSNGYAAFPAGTDLKLVESSATEGRGPGDNIIDRADKNCDLLVLGQTLTTDVSKNAGSRAQGEVHERVEDKIMTAACGFVAEVLNLQVIPSVQRLNYGEDDDGEELPQFRGEEEEEGTIDFKRQVFTAFMQDGTVCDVLANQTDLKQLTKDVGLPVNTEYEDPYLPVTDKSGAKVTGETRKNAEGKIVGGDVEESAGLQSESQPGEGESEAGTGKPAKATNEPSAAGTPKAPGAPGEPTPGEKLKGKNAGAPSQSFEDRSKDLVAPAFEEDLTHVLERLQAVGQIEDDALFLKKLQEFLGDFPKLKKSVLADPAAARALYPVLSAAMANGLSGTAKT